MYANMLEPPPPYTHNNNQAQVFIIKVRVQPECRRDDTTADGFVGPQTGRERGGLIMGDEGDDGGAYVGIGWGGGDGAYMGGVSVGKAGRAFTGGLKIMEVGCTGDPGQL